MSFTPEEATKERVDAYVVALEREREGYVFRLKALKVGKSERLDKDVLDARVKAVGDELARVKKLKPTSDNGGGAKPKADEIIASVGDLSNDELEDLIANDGRKTVIAAAQDELDARVPA